MLRTSPALLLDSRLAAERITTVLVMSVLRMTCAKPTGYVKTSKASMARMKASRCGGGRAAQIQRGRVQTASQMCAIHQNMKTTMRQCTAAEMAIGFVGGRATAVQARDSSHLLQR